MKKKLIALAEFMVNNNEISYLNSYPFTAGLLCYNAVAGHEMRDLVQSNNAKMQINIKSFYALILAESKTWNQ